MKHINIVRAVLIAFCLVLVAACGNSGGGGGGGTVAPAPVLPAGYYGLNQGASANYVGQLAVVNSQAFARMLTYANVCSTNWFAGFDWGDYNCSTWVNRGGYMALQSFGTGVNSNVVMQFAAGSQFNGTVGFSQQASVSLYNNSRGMQIVGRNAYGSGAGVRLVVDRGQLGDATITGRLYFQDQTSPFASVTLTLVGY